MKATGRHPEPAIRAPDGVPLHYRRHLPEQTALNRVVHLHAASFIAHTEGGTGGGLPRFFNDEFEAFLECDVLVHGFLRLRCGECGHDELLTFSCKRRWFCPSCGARGISQTAEHLILLHGVLAANAKLRSLVVPQGPLAQVHPAAEAAAAADCEAEPVQRAHHRISWAQLLKRVFNIYMQRYPICGDGELKLSAPILERPIIDKILTHLRLDPQPPPRGLSRELAQHFAA